MAAQWWEVAIPVAGTISSGLLGGWFGARWQLRNSSLLLSRQFEENQRAREAAEAEAGRARAEQLANDRALRLLDDKRAFYSRYLRVLDDYREARKEVDQLVAERDAADESESMDEMAAAFSALSEARDRCLDLTTELVELAYQLSFIASGRAGNLAMKLAEVSRGEGSEDQIREVWTAFVAAAREDIALA